MKKSTLYNSMYYHGKPIIDEKDKAIIFNRLIKLHKNIQPQVGDFIKRKDGKLARFSHEWDDGLQSSEGGSFYLADGGVSFSGALDPTIKAENIKETNETMMGWFWIFHHNDWCADNAVEFKGLCKVWKEI